MNKKTVTCVLSHELLPWESELFSVVLSELGPGYWSQMVSSDLNSGWLPTKEPSSDILWLVTRKPRQVLRVVPNGFQGRCVVSILGVDRRRPSIWRPLMDWLYPSRLARMHWLVHSPLLERFYSEMERVSRFPPQLVPLPMPNKSNWRVGDGLSSRSAMVFGTATYFGGQSNLHFFLVLAHYVHSRRPEVKFRIFGEGPLSPHIRRMIADLGLENVVETQVTDSPQCDAFLYLPMTNEHFIPILMAASAKIPVLSVDVPGIENYVTDGHDGFVVPMHDVRSLGELCFRFIENREMARFFGDRLKQKLERHFSWNVLQPVYNEFLLGETQLTVQSRAA